LTHLNSERLFAMLTKEVQVEIEILHRQGKGIREIARETGAARNTVRAVLRGSSDNCYGPRPPKRTKLSAHEDYVIDRIDAAGKVHLSAIVLLRELRERGYDGGVTQLKQYLRLLRPQLPPEPVIRFETNPGQQLQIDFVVFRRGAQPLRAFTAELGYSRYAFVAFADNERTDTLVASLESAFSFFGGVPAHVLCDNPKTIVIERDAYAEGRHRFNSLLLDVSKHYGFSIKLCAPYRAQTKGKVERFHRYLRDSFFAPLQTSQHDLVDVVTANREVRIWLNETANPRIHATLKQRPADRFEVERKALLPLPLPFGGIYDRSQARSLIQFPMPIESIQHPLATYETFAREISR
jgi:transposase